MSIQQNSITDPIPVGDLQLFDNYIPPLEAGNYFISVKQEIVNGYQTVNGDPIHTQQEFVVSAPQFFMDTSQIINQYPPVGSTGIYGEVLPHIVLKDPMLAWERSMDSEGTPWIAMMVFQESELLEGDDPNVKTTTCKVADFLNLASPTLAPKPIKEADIAATAACKYIKMPTKLFQQIVPRIDELSYLSHVRKVNTGGKSEDGINEDGIFSVTTSNRFAAAPPKSPAKPIKNIVHLVSLEGMEKYMAADADLSAYQNVALISLASWTFLSMPNLSADFQALAENFLDQETTSSDTIDPSLIALKLPTAESPLELSNQGNQMVAANQRIADGFVPLPYHTRSGENTFAWYRGPLAPILMEEKIRQELYGTSDSALIYDKQYGIFDVSLASAWEIGRAAALSDSHFAKTLIDFRNKMHEFSDTIFNHLISAHFQASDIENVNVMDSVQDQFLKALEQNLITNVANTANSSVVKPKREDDGNSQAIITDIKDFLQQPELKEKLQDLMKTELGPLAEWISQLLLLYPIPFNHMVPDNKMLPIESLRFFYIDVNWIEAAIDGAVSLGSECSKDVFFNGIIKGMVQIAGVMALQEKAAVSVSENENLESASLNMCGFLLRSSMVSAWPNLQIKPLDANGKPMKILRMNHLSPSVLLCILPNIPKSIEYCQPQESLGFGVDDDGKVAIRNITDNSKAIGDQLTLLQVRDLSDQNALGMRAAGSLVLNIAPSDPNGLVQLLIKSLSSNGSAPEGNKLGPSTFSLQMVKSAEAFVFNSQAN